MPKRTLTLIEHDPELADTLGAERISIARQRLLAVVRELSPGGWQEAEWSSELRSGLGLLVIEGLLLRRVSLNGRFGAELVGPGDLLRPWQREEEALASISRSSGWEVLQPSAVALLDLDFAKRLGPFPEVQGKLMARAMRRTFNLGVAIAIVHEPRVQTRLLMMLWHLADRWGKVRADGVLVPLRLTHATLAEMLAARRPTVSASLSALQREGRLAQESGGWILYGAPPGQLPRESQASE